MGLDLTLLPFHGGDADFSLTTLEFDRDGDAFEAIEEIAKKCGRDVPERFSISATSVTTSSMRRP